MKTLSALAVFYNTLTNVNSHSWVECTDYTAAINGQDYNAGSCEGYPRSWADQNSNSFAQDTGANYQPGGEGATGTWCAKGIGSPNDYEGTYTDQFPMAQYTSGSTVRVVWPAKNHANYECFANIPDASMKLYYNPNVNPTTDPNTLDDWSLAWDWHDGCTPGTDGCGFQNCPSFCDNTDGAVCYGDFTVDETLFTQGSGVYTFMWYWAFNGDGDIYSHCWEAYVDTAGAAVEPEEGNGGNNNNNNDKEYLIQVPICYDGGEYDRQTIVSAGETLYPDLDWAATGASEGNNKFNVTLQTHTGESVTVEQITSSADNDDHEFCDEIMNSLGGTGATCYSCMDVEVYRDGNGGGSNADDGDSTGSAIVAVVVVLVIVLVIIAAGIGYQKMQEKKMDGNSNASGMTTHIHGTNTQSNIIQTS